VAGGSFIVFVAQVAANAGFFVAVLVIARGLGPDGRGTVAFMIVSALILGRLAPVGLTEGTLIFASQRPASRPTLLANSLAFGGAAGALLGAVAAGVLLLLGSAAPAGIGPSEIPLLFVGTLAATIVGMTDSFLVACGLILRRAIVMAIIPWLYAGLVAAILLSGRLTAPLAVGAWATAMSVGGLALVAIAVSSTRPTRPVVSLLREAMAFGIRPWVGGTAGFLNMRVDQLILGVMAAPATLGIYAAAVNGGEVLLYLPASVATVLAPALAQMDRTALHARALRTFRILALTTTASVAGAAVVGPVFIPIVFGPRFQASVEPFLWLLPGAFGYAALKVFGSALLASSFTGRSPIGSIAALVAGVVLDLLLIPPFGAVGAAAAASGAFLVGGVVALALYRALFPFEWSRLIPGRGDVAVLAQLLSRFRAGLAPRRS
jgi:O-antigen/teichoic acid export membrane protein